MDQPASVMQRNGAAKYEACALKHPVLYDRSLRFPFARVCKFSGKTASTRREMRNKKGAAAFAEAPVSGFTPGRIRGQF